MSESLLQRDFVYIQGAETHANIEEYTGKSFSVYRMLEEDVRNERLSRARNGP